MTDKDRRIRNERIKLRRRHEEDTREIKLLKEQVSHLASQLAAESIKLRAVKEDYLQLCQGLGRNT